jgi:SAM-dependent methyltransferase
VNAGFAGRFVGKSADYVAARPGYPAVLFEALAELRALAPASEVADLGAGTGLLTRALLERGHRVVAVEPNAEMRAACDAQLGAHPGYASRAGSAEATGLPDASVDLITAAQAFHWFDVEAARAEALRILRPHGRVALIWNDRDPADALQDELVALFDRFGDIARQVMKAQDDRTKVPRFFGGPFVQRHCPHAQRLDRAGFASLAFSRSYMPPRDSERGRDAQRALDELFERHAADGALLVRYQTVLMLGRPQA